MKYHPQRPKIGRALYFENIGVFTVWNQTWDETRIAIIAENYT